MKKLIILLLLSTILFAKVDIIEQTKEITVYCIDGYVFARYRYNSSSLVQMYITRRNDGVPIPRQCIYQ